MLMKSEGAIINSINFCNRKAVKNYFDSVLLVMEKHNLVERQIFNVDKTWLSNYFYRCTVHLEDSLSITHQQMH